VQLRLAKAAFKQNGELLRTGTDVPKDKNDIGLWWQQSAAEHAYVKFLAKLTQLEQKTNEGRSCGKAWLLLRTGMSATNCKKTSPTRQL